MKICRTYSALIERDILWKRSAYALRYYMPPFQGFNKQKLNLTIRASGGRYSLGEAVKNRVHRA